MKSSIPTLEDDPYFPCQYFFSLQTCSNNIGLWIANQECATVKNWSEPVLTNYQFFLKKRIDIGTKLPVSQTGWVSSVPSRYQFYTEFSLSFSHPNFSFNAQIIIIQQQIIAAQKNFRIYINYKSITNQGIQVLFQKIKSC